MLNTSLSTSDFFYHLPDEKIAKFPLSRRDQSKLLAYQNGKISHHFFYDLPQIIPSDSVLIFNDTKVIPARLSFFRRTGAEIEILLLSPYESTIEQALSSLKSCIWTCEIGNLKKWKNQEPLSNEIFRINLLDREKKIVIFEWDNGFSFAENLRRCGEIPIPPYLRRKPSKNDFTTYQTIYAQKEGAIAAPTAGLHFTKEVFSSLAEKNISTARLTLHVGAGTFKPIKTQNPTDHDMHSEIFNIPKETINSLMTSKYIIAVGTTSLRTLESLYWFAVKLKTSSDTSFSISKLYPYRFDGCPISKNEALSILMEYMNREKLSSLSGDTSLMIVPGYKFSFSDALITNFHQPGSTLIMLIAAYVGEEWKNIYHTALENNYRFLSYGDSSILFYPSSNYK